MFSQLRRTELEYVRCFSEEFKEDNIIKFRDKNLEEIYAINITIIKDYKFKKDVSEIIIKEIKRNRKENKEFLIVEVDGEFKRKDLLEIRTKASRIDKLDYMYIFTKEYTKISSNNECKIIELKNEDDFHDAIELSLCENVSILGRRLATLKIKRKVEVYKDKNNNLTSFLCYYKGKAIGSCELLIHNNCAKVEDFGILKKYRGRGFGKELLSFAIKFANECGADIAYVITESDNTAKDMYERLGFKKCGEKTQIIYDFY